MRVAEMMSSSEPGKSCSTISIGEQGRVSATGLMEVLGTTASMPEREMTRSLAVWAATTSTLVRARIQVISKVYIGGHGTSHWC